MFSICYIIITIIINILLKNMKISKVVVHSASITVFTKVN